MPYLFSEGQSSHFIVLLSGRVTIIQVIFFSLIFMLKPFFALLFYLLIFFFKGGADIEKISSKEGSGEYGVLWEEALTVGKYRPSLYLKNDSNNFMSHA